MAEAYAESELRPAVERPSISVVDTPRPPSITLVNRPSRSLFASLRDNQLLELFAFGDLVILVSCSILAKILYVDLYLGLSADFMPYAAVGTMVSICYYGLMHRSGTYSAQRMELRPSLFRRMVISLFAAFALMLIVGYAMKVTGSYSRGWVLTWAASSTSMLLLYYVVSAVFLQKLVKQGRFGTKVAFISERGYAEGVKEQLRLDPRTNLSVVFSFDPQYDDAAPRDQVGLDRFIELAQMQDVDRIVLAIPSQRSATAEYLLERLKPVAAEIAVYNEFLSNNRRRVAVVRSGALDLFSVQHKPLSPWSYFAKSAFDRVMAATLIVLLAIPMLLIAMAIRYESSGGAMFVQRRHGLNNRVIRVLKFRTMHVKEDGERVIQACRDDERVTRVGRLLRRTSLDELPQLFNVLRGDMSLVGPRPHALAHNVHYTKMLVRYANRHRVKPGITGWAQVNGCRGSTQMPAQMRRRVEHDLFYIDNWSFWLDLKIIILTPFRGMFSENAY